MTPAPLNPQAALTTQLKIPETALVDFKPISFEGTPLGHLVRFEQEGTIQASWMPTRGERFDLGPSKSVLGLHVFNAAQEGSVPTGFSNSSGAFTGRGARSVLRIQLRNSTGDAAPKDGSKGPIKRRATGVERTVDAYFFDISTHGLRRIFKLRMSQQDADGFGGFKIKDLQVKKTANGWAFVGIRQDQLSARRARRRRPEPETVTYSL